MVIALAGRRVDAPDAKQHRFPLQNVEIVKKRICALLESKGASVLVSSAACGADLLSLAEAGSLKLRRRIVLPCDREKFRTTSVIDRPGDWGSLYDRVLSEVEKNGDLMVIRTTSEDEGYAEANRAILDEALSIGHHLQDKVTAVLVWDCKSRGKGDLTEDFGREARNRGIPVVDVMTL